MSDLWWVGPWLLRTLRTIPSTRFNELVIEVSDVWVPWFLKYPLSSDDSWGGVDAFLNALAERSPDFRVVFRGDINSFRYREGQNYDADSIVKAHLPLFSSKGLVKFEQVPHVENRVWKLGVP